MLNLRLIKLTYKLCKSLFAIDDKSALKQYCAIVISLLKNNGTLFTVKYMKQVKLHITRYMVGKPLMSNSVGVSLVGGFPRRFLFLKRYIDRRKLSGIKFVLTLLNISRSIRPKRGEDIPVDLSTILLPSKGTGYTIPASFIKEFCSHYDLHQSKPSYSTSDLVISLKAGPSGPSITTALYSFSLYSEEYMKIVRFFVGERLYAFLFNVRRYAELYKYSLPTKDMSQTAHIGRLSIVKDPDCKMRVIAILDYVSQFILKPIHLSIFGKLRNFECDRTFTQEPHASWLNNSEHFWSLDLSAATDRLPMDLQTKLMNYMFNSVELANSWRSLLQREYAFPIPSQKSGWYYAPLLGLAPTQWRVLAATPAKRNGCYGANYSVGQPMGAYSSWASLAVTHHLIVQYAAHLCGRPIGFNQYILLGDDIVIKDNAVALKYIWVMTQLGVDISESKTHVSKDTYEFAKRWIRGGNELTGLPLSGISDNIGSIGIFTKILFDYVYRGNLYLFRGTFSELVIRILTGHQVVSGPQKRGSKPRQGLTKTYLTEVIPEFVTTLRYISGKLTSEEMRSLLVRFANQEYIPVPCETLVPQYLRAVFTEEVVKLSVMTSNKYIDLVTDLQTYLTNQIRYLTIPDEDPWFDKIMWPIVRWLDIKLYPNQGPVLMRIWASGIEQLKLQKRLLWKREDLRHHQYHFTWYGIINHILRIRDKTRNYILENSSESLLGIVKNLSYLDFDELSRTERDVQKVVQNVRTLLFSGLRALELRRRCVAVNNNMEYILSGSLHAFVNYKSRGFGTDSWTEPERKLSLWAPLARLDRELKPVVTDISNISREVFRLPEPLPNWDW
nr:MAG: putative RNA dependent RNA polymerase [Xinjiang farmland mitovirus 5]